MDNPGRSGPELFDILVVDDAPANLQLLAGMLKQKGYRVRPVPSGRLALQAIESQHPDLILLDVRMPEMSGYEVCERLRADPVLKEIPIILLSALNETEDKVRGFQAGAVDYVTKPFQFEEVEARVRTHLELRAQRVELERSYRRLRELEAFRDRLVHMVVHDLRSPLTVALGYLSLLEESTSLPDDLRKVRTVGASLESLLEMVSSVLDVNKIESGEMTLLPRDCDLMEIASAVVERVRVLSSDRSIGVVPPGEPVVVEADRELVSRVLQNLLYNALKYTPSGAAMRIRMQAIPEGVHIAVEDEGPGIPPQYCERIFEKYGQIEEGEFKKPYSTGLGLTFCKLAVEAHGGQIGVDSTVGRGSSFWFTLPRRAPEPGGLVPAPFQGEEPRRP